MATTAYSYSETYNGTEIVISAYLNTGILTVTKADGVQVPERTHTIILTSGSDEMAITDILTDDLVAQLSVQLQTAKDLIDNVSDSVLNAELENAGYVSGTALDAPANFMSVGGVGAPLGEIDLAWDNDVLADTYIIQRSKFPDDDVETIYNGVYVATYADTGLASGVTYYYRIFAHNSTSNSPFSYLNDVAP